MIKKLIAIMLIASLFAVPVYAQSRTTSPPIQQREGQTNFSNIACLGGPGAAPGYIMLHRTSASTDEGGAPAADADDYTTEVFYLWVGSDGSLRIASPDALAVGDGLETASPPTTYWQDASGPKVGKQH